MIPMFVSIGAICVLRAIWVFFVFPLEPFHSLIGIYTIYPISWSLGIIFNTLALLVIYPKIKKSMISETKIIAE
jgi:hypothetical protein